jgi:hypothetical protein
MHGNGVNDMAYHKTHFAFFHAGRIRLQDYALLEIRKKRSARFGVSEIPAASLDGFQRGGGYDLNNVRSNPIRSHRHGRRDGHAGTAGRMKNLPRIDRRRRSRGGHIQAKITYV